MMVADVPGVIIAGVTIDAGTVESPVLLQVGKKNRNNSPNKNDPSNPTTLSDVYFRVGGPHIGKANVALEVNSNNVLIDHTWVWRADHGIEGSFGYELPKLENKSAFVKAVFGGWQLNGIFQGQTGFPLLVTDPVLDIYGMTNRPNMTCDPNEGAPHEVTQWFNTSCFQRRPVAATAARPGSEPRNEVRGPGFNRTDLSVFKHFTFSKTHQIQIRIEAFNLFNQARFGQPVSNISAANFGQITSADDGRIIQLGIKYSF